MTAAFRPRAWTAADAQSDHSWVLRLTPAEADGIHAALRHAVRAGKVPVVMPRRYKYGEHVDDHQLEFARQLSQTDLVVVAEEPEDLHSAVLVALVRQRAMRARPRSAQMLQLVGDVLRGYASNSKV